MSERPTAAPPSKANNHNSPSSFNVERIILYGWNGNSRLPSSSTGWSNQTVQNLVLHLSPGYHSGRNGGDEYGPENLYHSVSTFTITLGWYKRDRRRPKASPEQCALAVLDTFLRHAGWVDDPKFIISPYLEDGDHSYCFPVERPEEVTRSPHSGATITLHSDCTCERGDTTGSKYLGPNMSLIDLNTFFATNLETT